MADSSSNDTERIIERFNARDFAGATAALKVLQEQDSREEPQQWQRHIGAINANVNLGRLGVNDASQILGVDERGQLLTASGNQAAKQVRSTDSNLTLRDQTPFTQYVMEHAITLPRDQQYMGQIDSVNRLQREAEAARLPKLAPGDHSLSLTVDGHQREYDVHVPANPSGRPMPVVFALHGAGVFDAPPGEMASEAGLNRLADERGFIAVYPYAQTHEQNVTGNVQLLGMNFGLNNQHISYHSWNSSGAGLNETRRDYDDVNYLRAVRDNVARQLNTDPARNYYLGFSEGGEFLHHAASRLGAAGIVSIHGTHLGTEAPPTRATAFMSITSEQDGVLPRNGGESKFAALYPRLATSLPTRQFDVWRAANGCTGHPQSEVTPDQMVLRYRPEQCASGREVTDINRFEGGHTIDGNFTFGSVVARLLGERKDNRFDAGRTAIDFLMRQRLAQ